MHTEFNFAAIAIALPEVFLASLALLALLVGAFTEKSRASHSVAGLSFAGVLITFFLMLSINYTATNNYAFPYSTPEGQKYMFVMDDFTFYIKTLLLLVAALVIAIARGPLERLKANRFEFYILVLLATTGMMVATSATHLIPLYMGLELMSFPLYILAAFQRDSARSAEAGLKYFVMGSLASGLLLFGMSYLYGIAGGLGFADVAAAATQLEAGTASLPLVVAIVLMLTAVAFKLSAAPFHMWTPDVYQGAPTPVTAFMAAGPKIAAFAVLMRLLFVAFAPATEAWLQVVIALSILTMGVGAYMAIVQHNIKRLLAYSSIGHVGFMLVGLVAGFKGVQGILVYLTIYSITVLGAFGVLMLLRQKDVFLENLEDMAGLWQTAPGPAFMLLVLLFSIAGVPPLAGFFAKFYVFNAAVGAGYTWLAVLGVLFSVVAAYYVLRVIKTMFFEPAMQDARPIDTRAPRTMYLTLVLSVFFSLGYIFYLQPFNTATEKAAKSLLGVSVELPKAENLHAE